MSEEVKDRRLARAEEKVTILETMIEGKTRELYLSNETLRTANDDLSSLYDAMPGALLIIEGNGALRKVNPTAMRLLGINPADVPGKHLADFDPEGELLLREATVALYMHKRVLRKETTWLTRDEGTVPMLVSFAALRGPAGGFVCVGVDIRERKQLEVELRHAQKLESVGQLAAGIAHEINTPMQFIGDNVHFLRDAFAGVLELVHKYEALRAALPPGAVDHSLLTALDETAATIDFDYLKERAPRAADRALEGVGRVSKLVSAMKAFSHPSRERAPTDLNACVETTLTVARNEYKYVAELVTELGALPQVVCNSGDMNQVFLNLIVNAAHAIEAKIKGTEQRGKITVKSTTDGDFVIVSVQDDGAGIPEAIRHRVFDPFFTTKEVGKGTGQGLAISRTVVDAHGGTLRFESKLGVGTTFFVRLPVAAQAAKRVA